MAPPADVEEEVDASVETLATERDEDGESDGVGLLDGDINEPAVAGVQLEKRRLANGVSFACWEATNGFIR